MGKERKISRVLPLPKPMTTSFQSLYYLAPQPRSGLHFYSPSTSIEYLYLPAAMGKLQSEDLSRSAGVDPLEGFELSFIYMPRSVQHV